MPRQGRISNPRWIYLVTFLDFFAVALLLPAMGLHLNKLGASFSTIGAIASIYAAVQLVSGPLIGSWSDKIGRKNIFIVSCVIIGVCYAMFGLVSSIFLMFILRIIIGIFKHSQVMIQALIADVYPKDIQSVMFGNLKSIIGLSFTLGPLIAGHMTEIEGGFSIACGITGILFIINAVIAYYFIDDKPRDKKTDVNDEPTKPVLKIIKSLIDDLREIDWSVFGDAFALKFAGDSAKMAFFSNYNIRIKDRFDVSPKVSGYTIAFISMIGIITGLFSNSINEKFYKDDLTYRKRLIHAFGMMSFAFTSAFFAINLWFYQASTFLFSIANMIITVALTEMIVERATATHQGSVAGSTESIGSLARLIAPVSTGIIDDLFGANSTNLLAAALGIFGLVIAMKLPKADLKGN